VFSAWPAHQSIHSNYTKNESTVIFCATLHKGEMPVLALETWIPASIPKPDLHFEINFLASY
jgi:hypothetical protein